MTDQRPESHQCEERVALITGASRGIGEATARALAVAGYALVLAARSVEPLTALSEELAANGCPSLVVPTDMQDPEAVQHLVHAALERFGRIDVLVNNAAIANPGVVSRLSDAEVQAVLATNLAAPIALTRAVLPVMLARGRGTIIFVDSAAGYIALPSAALYSATKFGLRGFAMALRREVAHAGLSVTVVSPGFVITRLTESVRTEILPKFPLFMGRPEMVARAIVAATVRPRREVIIPGYYRIFITLERSFPWIMDFVARLYVRHVLIKKQLV